MKKEKWPDEITVSASGRWFGPSWTGRRAIARTRVYVLKSKSNAEIAKLQTAHRYACDVSESWRRKHMDAQTEIAQLRQTLDEIREHVFADLTPETAPPRNRLQIIAAKVDKALDDVRPKGVKS